MLFLPAKKVTINIALMRPLYDFKDIGWILLVHFLHGITSSQLKQMAAYNRSARYPKIIRLTPLQADMTPMTVEATNYQKKSSESFLI